MVGKEEGGNGGGMMKMEGEVVGEEERFEVGVENEMVEK